MTSTPLVLFAVGTDLDGYGKIIFTHFLYFISISKFIESYISKFDLKLILTLSRLSVWNHPNASVNCWSDQRCDRNTGAFHVSVSIFTFLTSSIYLIQTVLYFTSSFFCSFKFVFADLTFYTFHLSASNDLAF